MSDAVARDASVDGPPSATHPAPPRWVRLLPWLVGGVALVSALGVFVLPWLVPIRAAYVQSESVGLGFSNRTAQIALGVGTLVLAAIGLVWRRLDGESWSDASPALVADRVASEQIDRRLAIALMIALAGLLTTLAVLFGRYPTGDPAYFADRLLTLASGARLYADFEFAYGPGLLYPAYWLWLALRGVGLDLYHSYYVVSVAGHVLGLGLAVYLLNRLRVPRSWKHALLVLVFVFDFIGANLGLNYSPLRFLLPFAALVWASAQLRRGALRGIGAAAASCVVAFAVSPEMGVCASVALTVMLALEAAKARPVVWIGAGATTLLGVGGAVAYGTMRGSEFTVFSAGAGQMPVLPGLPAMLFVATMLVLGFAVGVTSDVRRWSQSALQAGWLAGSVVLIVVALGRADFGHLLWNGLPAVLLAVACLWQLGPQPALAYLSVAFATFVFMASSFSATALPAVYTSAVRSGAITRQQSTWIARHLGRGSAAGQRWWDDARLAEPTAEQVDALVRSGSVAAPNPLQGALGERLATSGVLVPTFVSPGFGYTPDNAAAIRASLSRARFVLLPRYIYTAYRTASASSMATASPEAVMAKASSDPTWYGMLQQFPLHIRAVHPTYDPVLAFALELRADWVADRWIGGYVVLRRR